MSDEYENKLKGLLRKLFQFDEADLDFGIYRIMNRKREEINRFIDEDLIDAVEKALEEYSAQNAESIKREVDEAKARLISTLGDSAILPDGSVKPEFRETPAAKEYETKREMLKSAEIADREKANIFNHIYQFFSRYYDNGDFISLRRYSHENKYCVPYNGEETLLHWATKDQYYIKTAEEFYNYSFDAGEWKISFRIEAAETEANNNKSAEKRYFVLADEGVQVNEEEKEVVARFEYRGISDSEKKELGASQDNKIREKLNERTAEAILAAVDDSLRKILNKKEVKKGEESKLTLLEKHIKKYSTKNSTDYFIHKDLKGFLEREMDFYIKNEFFLLDDIESRNMSEADIRRIMTAVRTFREISHKIIDFLAQIEELQKKLWEKKKFVVKSDYCITLDRIPEEFYDEILANSEQLEEWKRLYALENEKQTTIEASAAGRGINREFLKSHKYMMLDTKFFDADFKYRLLATFDNLDGETDGLLIKSENWQALNLLQEKYREKIKTIYIDPPYNTGNDGFIYKDRYQHSSWLAMMQDRISKGLTLLFSHGIHLTSIGDDEYDNLSKLLNNLFSMKAIPFVWKSRAKPTNAADAIYRPQVVAEFVLLNMFTENTNFYPLKSGEMRRYPHTDELGKYRITTILTSNLGRYRRETMRFEIDGYIPPSDKRWKAGYDEIKKLYDTKRIAFNEKGEPYQKIYEKDEKELHIPLWTFMPEEITGTAESGKNDLSLILGKEHGLDSVKPKELIQVFLNAAVPEGWVLDYFAGSGTTGHAVINLNREDGGHRKYILVEMGDYFDTVLKPRIQKVVFSANWKDGVPQDTDTGISHMFKYMYLEQYEDTLNNIVFTLPDGTVQKTLFDSEDYFLNYMLDFESRDSPCRLNPDLLSRPFDYEMRIMENGAVVNKKLDLVETFNYLLGLTVDKIERRTNGENEYVIVRGRQGGKSVVVIWRSTDGLNLEADKKFVEREILGENEPELLYMNGQSFVPRVLSIEKEFKLRMGA